MADALCGPSSALQSFQKHTAVDRSLQQDRLAFRPNPAQSFRSSPQHDLARVEADFHAFQAAPAQPAPRLALNNELLRPQKSLASLALPNWAAEFQRLGVSDGPGASLAPVFPAQAPQIAPQPVNWHQEFLQANPASSFNATSFQSQYSQPSAPSYFHSAAPFAQGAAYTSASPQPFFAEHKEQGEQEQALFQREFDLIQQEIDVSESKGKEREPAHESHVQEPSGRDILAHADAQMGDITGDYDYDRGVFQAADDVNVADQLRTLRRDGGWEAVEAYERALQPEMGRSDSPLTRDMYDNISRLRQEEVQSHTAQQASPLETPNRAATPLDPVSIRIGADTIPSTQQQAEPPGSEAEADELSRTAGDLLRNLREESSDKFQKSSFMELMRQLRDKEAHIEGDNMVKQESHPGGKFYPSDAFAPSAAAP